MCRSRGPRARAGMELGTHKGGCGGTVGERHLVEQKSTKFEAVVARGSRLPWYRSGDGDPSTDCTTSDGRAVLVAVVGSLPVSVRTCKVGRVGRAYKKSRVLSDAGRARFLACRRKLGVQT